MPSEAGHRRKYHCSGRLEKKQNILLGEQSRSLASSRLKIFSMPQSVE
jgi:hypothetical protein